jgi:acetyl-CoA synthetase (ADP-forming)
MSRTLSEADSKALLAPYGVPFPTETLVASAEAAVAAAAELGGAVAAKLCGTNISHKTERGLVRLGLSGDDAVRSAAQELLDAARPEDEATGVLIAPMLAGNRELIAGIAVDEQFGPTVLVGIGGVLAEAVADVAVRLVPIERVDAEDMLDQLRGQALLGTFRGEPPVDRDAVVDVLVALSDAATAHPELRSVDLNPLIVVDGRPVAVDALVELGPSAEVAA